MPLTYELVDMDKFEALEDVDKDYLHNNLPWNMMFVDMAHVTEDTIPHIVARMKMGCPEIFDGDIRWLDQREFEPTLPPKLKLEKYLERFISFECNVYMLTSTEFMKKVAKDIPKLTRKDCDKLYSKHRKEKQNYRRVERKEHADQD